jgi:hypothetical protein
MGHGQGYPVHVRAGTPCSDPQVSLRWRDSGQLEAQSLLSAQDYQVSTCGWVLGPAENPIAIGAKLARALAARRDVVVAVDCPSHATFRARHSPRHDRSAGGGRAASQQQAKTDRRRNKPVTCHYRRRRPSCPRMFRWLVWVRAPTRLATRKPSATMSTISLVRGPSSRGIGVVTVRSSVRLKMQAAPAPRISSSWSDPLVRPKSSNGSERPGPSYKTVAFWLHAVPSSPSDDDTERHPTRAQSCSCLTSRRGGYSSCRFGTWGPHSQSELTAPTRRRSDAVAHEYFT